MKRPDLRSIWAKPALNDPANIHPDEKAALIPADKTVSAETGSFCDTIPACGVAVYTTKKD